MFKFEQILDIKLTNYHTVSVGDTAYNNPRFIHGIQRHKNLIHIARLQSNRIIYRTPAPKQLKITKRRERGHEL